MVHVSFIFCSWSLSSLQIVLFWTETVESITHSIVVLMVARSNRFILVKFFLYSTYLSKVKPDLAKKPVKLGRQQWLEISLWKWSSDKICSQLINEALWAYRLLYVNQVRQTMTTSVQSIRSRPQTTVSFIISVKLYKTLGVVLWTIFAGCVSSIYCRLANSWLCGSVYHSF